MKNTSRSPLFRKLKIYTGGMVAVILGLTSVYSSSSMSDPVYFASLALTLGIYMYCALRFSRPAAILCPFEDWQTFFSKFSSIAADMDYLPESCGNGFWEFAPAPPPEGQKTPSKANSKVQQIKLRVDLTAPKTVRISGIAVVVKEIRRKFVNTIPAKVVVWDPSLQRRARFITAGVVLVLIVLPLIVILRA